MDGTLMIERCRVCGKPIHAHLCLNTIMVECNNPRCRMYGYDLDAATYDRIDLSKYQTAASRETRGTQWQ